MRHQAVKTQEIYQEGAKIKDRVKELEQLEEKINKTLSDNQFLKLLDPKNLLSNKEKPNVQFNEERKQVGRRAKRGFVQVHYEETIEFFDMPD